MTDPLGPAEARADAASEAERAVLDAAWAYHRARYAAFALAQQGDRRAYEQRSAEVDRLSRAMLVAIMALAPHHPNDRP